MFKPEELVPREVWTVVLSKLSAKDKLSCRCVCVSFKKEVDSILKNNQDRLWLRHWKFTYGHYFCYDKDHSISSRDTLYFYKTISIENLMFVSSLMPSLKILQIDPCCRERYYEWYEYDDWYLYDYRHEKHKAVPITKIFPQVACLILSGQTETDNFVGHLSQLKHLTIFQSVVGGSPTFPNLDSLEMRIMWDDYDDYPPMPSKRFVMPGSTIEWSTLPKTLEVIETGLNCGEYISVGKPHFSNLKILKGLGVGRYEANENVETLMNFLKDHKGSLTELSFSVREEVANIKVLLPLLTRLQKLSVEIETDRQAIELKEIKPFAHNLQYFEISLHLWEWSDNSKNLGAILENLPTGLDNLSIKYVRCYEEINTFMEKIMENIVNGDTKRVTIASINNDDECGKTKAGEYVDEYEINDVFSNIVKMKPESVRVEKKNTRVFEEDYSDCTRRRHFSCVYDIVISL